MGKRMDVIGQNGNDGLHYSWLQDGDERTPDHYNQKIQPWDYMQANMSEEAFKGYLKGNIIKYISRYEDKGGKGDLEKAKHYIDKLMEVY